MFEQKRILKHIKKYQLKISNITDATIRLWTNKAEKTLVSCQNRL